MALTKLNARSATALDATILIGNLPALNGSAITTINASNISSGTLSTSRYVQGGITEYDMWVVTSSFNNVPGHISSNWSRFSDTGFEKIGTGITNSGYSFIFPSTGKYIVDFHVCYYINDTNKNRFFEADIEYTNDDWSNGHRLGEQYANIASGIANTYSSLVSTALVDITNTTNDKVRFRINSDNDSTWAYVYGTSGTFTTGATFRKIGDT